jgi:hypothetical protein
LTAASVAQSQGMLADRTPVLLDLLAVAVLAFVGHRLLTAVRISLRGGGRSETATILRGLRLHHVALALPVLVVVANVAFLLVQVPGLDFGWWTAIGGTGNPVTGTTERTEGTALAWIVPLAFLLLLLPALPLLAYREERLFRMGDEDRTRWERMGRGVLFGMTHALIGIPIGVCLALSLGGWYFSWRYLRGFRRGGVRGGLLESARAHVAYNGVIVVLALTALALGEL